MVFSTRGEGRSPYANFTRFHYDDFTRDAIALLDHLKIPRVAVVGWSDGAITGLDLAMNYSSRIERVFAHGANIQANMSIPGLNDPIINSDSGSLDSDFATNGTTYSVNGRALRRRETDVGADPYSCESLSPMPERCTSMEQGVAE
jgi:pimeloyl-ACP methyl ester carboxylesterase